MMMRGFASLVVVAAASAGFASCSQLYVCVKEEIEASSGNDSSILIT